LGAQAKIAVGNAMKNKWLKVGSDKKVQRAVESVTDVTKDQLSSLDKLTKDQLTALQKRKVKPLKSNLD